MKKNILKTFAVFLTSILLMFSFSIDVSGKSLTEELFGISFYNFHYVDENGKEKEKDTYNWGSEDEKENGIKIEKTSLDTIKLEISANCELYNQTKPVLIWVHKGDGLFDITKYTDIKQWYTNKLSETFLLQQINYTGEDISVEIKVPMKLNMGGTGLINGGFYEVDFYDEGSIPEELLFSYEIQNYSLEELEKYINTEMSENIADYYNADSGFRPEKDGFAFANTDFNLEGNAGVCSGIASVTTAKYNGYELVKDFKFEDEEYTVDNNVEWYSGVFGNTSINDIKYSDYLFNFNIPKTHQLTENTATAFPLQKFSRIDVDNKMLGGYLTHYKLMNNKTAILGNSKIAGLTFANLENRWSIIDYVASYLRQGKAVTVNISKTGGGHAIVGYKLETINENTYRLWCYDNCYPNDYCKYFIDGKPENYDTNEDGSYKNVVWKKRDVYIDFTKTTKRMFVDQNTYKEIDVFDFDSSNTSIVANSKNGDQITFTLCKGDKVGLFNYGNESNEVISYKAYPVIKNNKTVEIRTFAFYQSGEAREITNSQYTNVKMDYSFIGQYKIKNSQVILTDKALSFAEKGNSYVDVFVSYDNNKENFGQIKVRIPVNVQ